MPASEFFTTLQLPLRSAWVGRASTLDVGRTSHPQLLRRVIHAAREYETLVLNGSLMREQIAAALLALRHRRSCRVVLADCTWSRGGNVFDRAMNRVGIRVIDRGDPSYCVLSSDERRVFPHTWGVDPSRVVFTPWCYTLSEEELSSPVSDEGFVFAGGDSLRDYSPLIEASRGLDASVRIAARRSVTSDRWLPANIDAGCASHHEFIELMATATVVVVPMEARDDRSAGQGTYLNAMALGKPVIVSDVMGARDYIEPEETGLIVRPGDARVMREALDWVLADENRGAVQELGARAQGVVRERFAPEAYVEALLRVVDGATAS